MKKVVIATPTYKKPHDAYIEAMEKSVPALDALDIEHKMVFEVGSPYISCARATLLRKALDYKADIVIFMDDDVAPGPDALAKLIEADAHVIAGTYRYKLPEEEYMGDYLREPPSENLPIVNEKGWIKAQCVPAGFLKVTKEAVDRFMVHYPELTYGPQFALCVDLFNHGAHKGLWWGEDYAFSRRWREMGEDLWILPDLDLDHHGDGEVFKGNYHEFLLRQPGGSKCSERSAA